MTVAPQRNYDGSMKQTIADDATFALRLANLTCNYAAFQVLGGTRLSVATTHYRVAERVLADAGLELVDVDPDDSMTLARIVRAR